MSLTQLLSKQIDFWDLYIVFLFISFSSGSDVVDWLYSHVEGFADRREARKYACNLLKVFVSLNPTNMPFQG